MMKPNITPVGTFQRITSTAPLRAETREAIQNTVLQFYVQNSQPEDDAEGLTACYERLSQVSTPFQNVDFRRNGMSFFTGQHTGVIQPYTPHHLPV